MKRLGIIGGIGPETGWIVVAENDSITNSNGITRNAGVAGSNRFD